MAKENYGYLTSCGENYGSVGSDTPLRDDEGTRLKIGDVVSVVSTDGAYNAGSAAVVHSVGKAFVMGIEMSCGKDGSVRGWKIHKVRSFSDVADGENIDGIVYHKAEKSDGKPEFHVGQRVRIRSWESMEKEFGHNSCGSIAAKGSFSKSMRPLCGRTATIASIDGKYVELKDWNDYSGDTHWQFSTDMLEPAGFEVGRIEKGIKKYDADHAEKKTGVREVKRHARVGEYIKIVHQFCNLGYQDGDILRVIKEWNGTSVICEGARICVCDSEYVVLEGYKPEQKEERRKAKVGDTVRVLKDNGGPVGAGTTWKVDAVHNDGVLTVHNDIHTAPIWAISFDNYVILSSGKHIYTDSKISEAKAFVLDTIRDLAEKDINVIFSHTSGNEDDNSAFTCYVLDHDSSIDADEDGFTADAKRHDSICSESDEPNEWIGKAVALCKALHKPLPSYVL